jgi:hypothetical protein
LGCTFEYSGPIQKNWRFFKNWMKVDAREITATFISKWSQA